MNKNFIIDILKSSRSWKEGQIITFRHENWELILRKEEAIYNPFTFSISGKKCNSNETISRRYINAESALLHVLNDFNENSNVKNKYQSFEEALRNME